MRLSNCKRIGLSACLALLTVAPSFAQAPLLNVPAGEPAAQGQVLVYLLQGEKTWITEDYVAELDANSQLRVSLSDSGLSQPAASDEFLVTLIQSNGKSVEMTPDANGDLLFEDVAEGWSALVVVAKNMAMQTQPAMYAAMPVFTRAAQADAPAKAPVSVQLASVDRERLVREVKQTGETPPESKGELLPIESFEMAAGNHYVVKQSADGSVKGRVIVPQRGFEAIPGVTQIAFYRDGNYLLSTASTAEGDFAVSSLPLGMNSLVATGPSGHTAFSFEVIAENEGELVNPTAGVKSDAGSKFVSMQGESPESLYVVLIPPAMMPEVKRIVEDNLGGGAPPPTSNLAGPGAAGAAQGAAPGGGFPIGGMGGGGGGFGGGGFGGGGGGLGGGGAGGLLIGAGAIAAAVAASNDDDGFNLNVATAIAPPPIQP